MNYSNLPIFYCPDIEKDNMLSETEAHHAIKVLRLVAGDNIVVTDGMGNFFHSVIRQVGKRDCIIDIVKKEKWHKSWNGGITLAISPTKNIDRMEWMVEKLVEIGVDKIIFMRSEHSERKHIRQDRIEKIVISAMKQSLKAVMPIVEINTDIKDVLVSSHSSDNKLIAHCDDFEDKINITKGIKKVGGNTIILIGPEGDFSRSEIMQAKGNGFVSVSLGDCRLRTETAGMFAVSAVHLVSMFVD